MAGLGENGGPNLRYWFRDPQKGTSLRGTASFDVFCVKNRSARLGYSLSQQEAQLSPSDRALRLVSSRPNLANYHATVQKLLIRQVLTKQMYEVGGLVGGNVS